MRTKKKEGSQGRRNKMTQCLLILAKMFENPYLKKIKDHT